jgi:lipoprotein YgeR
MLSFCKFRKQCEKFILFVMLLSSCQHYSSNVEIVYKNPNNASYEESGSNVLLNQNYEQEKVKIVSSNSSTAEPEKNVFKPIAKINNTEAKTESMVVTENNANLENVSKNETIAEKYHVVQKGETYYSVSRLYFVNPKTLIQINNANPNEILQVGKMIKLPNEVEDFKETPSSATKKQNEVLIERDIPANAPLLASNTGKSACGEKFVAPIKSGKILYQFNQKLDGGIKSDGIIFQISSEEPVFASNDGEVVYVGDGFSDYGNILIVKHHGNYFSIYGYLKLVTLKKGQRVIKGDKISSTSLKEKKFYFSIRQGKVAINPAKCL